MSAAGKLRIPPELAARAGIVSNRLTGLGAISTALTVTGKTKDPVRGLAAGAVSFGIGYYAGVGVAALTGLIIAANVPAILTAVAVVGVVVGVALAADALSSAIVRQIES
ncbi:hypothetical protein Acor_36730 [Acrocarpospora corrugata]|uniref:Uncharacterized protein n=1 Tax=Acrocarpospora corrugata TaxID=35763 RepID=A0A5M3W014_9ACTN|nr:hypothetical protein [Acrocarpospora corrugata]GES01609.1 hypothetical protein Acor_36730 [Acrocarpospora corrugata]